MYSIIWDLVFIMYLIFSAICIIMTLIFLGMKKPNGATLDWHAQMTEPVLQVIRMPKRPTGALMHEYRHRLSNLGDQR